MNENLSSKTPGEQKIDEYIERIRSGEDRESIVTGLPEIFRKGIDDRLQEAAAYQKLDEQIQIDNLRSKIMDLEPKAETGDSFADFSMANGETDTGCFWYQYRNQEAKKMKESGKFEWGKERIYFDVSFEDMEKLRDVVIRVAGEQKIAIAFKYLDIQKTFDSQKDGSETRFVVNFASIDDAKIFFSVLKKNREYQEIRSDQKTDYKGIRIDDKAEYASGFREKREAIERLVHNARLNESSGKYEYSSGQGKLITIEKEDYNRFVSEYSASEEALDILRKQWEYVSEFE